MPEHANVCTDIKKTIKVNICKPIPHPKTYSTLVSPSPPFHPELQTLTNLQSGKAPISIAKMYLKTTVKILATYKITQPITQYQKKTDQIVRTQERCL